MAVLIVALAGSPLLNLSDDLKKAQAGQIAGLFGYQQVYPVISGDELGAVLPSLDVKDDVIFVGNVDLTGNMRRKIFSAPEYGKRKVYELTNLPPPTLPKVLWQSVGGYIPGPDVARLGSASKELGATLSEDVMWRTYLKQLPDMKISLEEFKTYGPTPAAAYYRIMRPSQIRKDIEEKGVNLGRAVARRSDESMELDTKLNQSLEQLGELDLTQPQNLLWLLKFPDVHSMNNLKVIEKHLLNQLNSRELTETLIRLLEILEFWVDEWDVEQNWEARRQRLRTLITTYPRYHVIGEGFLAEPSSLWYGGFLDHLANELRRSLKFMRPDD